MAGVSSESALPALDPVFDYPVTLVRDHAEVDAVAERASALPPPDVW